MPQDAKLMTSPRRDNACLIFASGCISKKYKIECASVVTAMKSPSFTHYRMVAVVGENVLDRARFRTDGAIVDAFISSEQRLVSEFKSKPLHLLKMVAYGEHLSGNTLIFSRLKEEAGKILAGNASEPAPGLSFRYSCQPYDLLRKFDMVSRCDPFAASLIAGSIVRLCLDAYIDRNRLWRPEDDDVLRVVTARSPECGNLLREVLEASPFALAENPEPLRRLVDKMVGEEPRNEEVWLDAVRRPRNDTKARTSRRIDVTQTLQAPLSTSRQQMLVRRYADWQEG